MKKRFLNIFCFAAAMIVVAACNSGSKNDTNNDVISDSVCGDTSCVEAVEMVDSAATIEEDNSDANRAELEGLTERFYSRLNKSQPILSMFTDDFANVMRHAQSSVGLDGVKGYTNYCFTRPDAYGSENGQDWYRWNVSEVLFDGESNATVEVSMSAHYSGPSADNTDYWTDELTFVKRGSSWKISNIIQDETDMKEWISNNPPCPA